MPVQRRSNQGHFRILLVETNPVESDLWREAIRSTERPIELHVATSGSSALRTLHARKVTDAPDLILVDLSRADGDGEMVLRTLKDSHSFRKIPVVAMTAPTGGVEVTDAYRKGANACFGKPVDAEVASRVMKSLTTFWFSVAQLPPRSTGSH